jgi:hypothetical protein
VTGASIHYHIEIFTTPKKFSMGFAGVVGITALILGLIAYFHILQGMPPATMYALLGAGGGLVLVDLIALITLGVQHHNRATAFDKLMEKESALFKWYGVQFEALDLTQGTTKRMTFTNMNLNGIWYVQRLLKTLDRKEIHVFECGKENDEFRKNLIENEGFSESKPLIY